MSRGSKCCVAFGLLAAGFGSESTVFAEPPRKIAEYATIAELETELTDRLTELEPLLAESDAFADNKKKIAQVSSMLVVAAQSLAEHEGDSPKKPFAPDLRDAAIQIARAETSAAATDGLTAAKAALAGKSDKKAPVEYDWAKLVKQRAIMEDTENRMQQLQRALRRPKDPVKESQIAIASALASLPTLVDTHEVKDKEKLPEWNMLAVRMLDELKAVTTAIKNKDQMEAQAQFKAARATCVECHRLFKKEN